MVEIAISVAAKVVEFLVGPIARPFSYIWNYKTNFDNLKTEVRKLEGQKETVQNSVDLARRNGDQIKQRVSDWLVRVEKITDEASEVIEENQRANMKCFKGLCPNPKRRYQHSRKAVKKAKAIVELYADGNFQTVSIRTNPEDIWIPSYKGYMVFESRMSTFKDVLDALSNPDVNMVGIYGTGGIGKTMLAREIAGQAEDKKLFNVVAFAEVAVKPDIKYIQQEIAEKLGLTFRDENPSGRARHLQQRLKQEEKVLLVLDNIWERLNLEDVGIPFGNDHKGCKLLLTARSLDVLSNKMDSQSNFKVDFLDKGEAWSLFEKKAGACDRLQALAKNVAKACGGLPIAINSVAVALKAKEEFEWKDALRKLTTPSASNFEGVAAETYSSIEISYSQLKERELKSTFLLCCIMGDTYVEDLLGYGMGLGIFEGVEAMEDEKNRVNTLVRKLKDSSLLLDINNNRISLHDVVRDVGRSIASRDGHMLTVANNYIPREWVDKDILKNCVGISLYNISKLPEEFECPELQFFYMSTAARDLCRVPNNFFAGMPKLKVLHLARMELYSVSNSIRLLVNLRTLYICDCKLRDVDFIGEFTQLEIFRIRGSFGSEIEMIPKKMCNLTRFRLLDLNDCYNLRIIPPNVLSTFTQLEELYLPAEIKWEVEGVNILDELKHLTHLTALEIIIPDANVLPKGRLLSNKLERYRIIIGSCMWYGFPGQTSRNVKLNLETSSCSDDVQKFFSLLDREGFPELEYLHVENSPCFRTVVDCLESESCHHFLSLQSLSLHSVLNLEMIHSYPLKDKAGSFRQLRTITVKKCNKLKNILSFSTYRALPLLQKVYVSSCDNMEEIFAIRGEEEINNNEGIDQIEFKHLRTVTVKKCNKLKNILSFSIFRALPLLQEVDVSSCDNMEEIFAIRGEEVINNDEGTDHMEFKQLRSLKLHSLPKLTSFCSINNNKDMLDTPTLFFNQKVVFSNLEALKLCSINFEKIWHNELPAISSCFQCLRLSIEECNNLKVTFPSLEEIKISKSNNFKILWQKGAKESFCNLKSVEVSGCDELLTIFQFNTLEGLSMSKLLTVTISNCASVEEIFDLQKVNFEGSHSRAVMYHRLQKLNINWLPKLKHIWKKDPQAELSFEELPMPKSLKVRYCDSIEEIFDLQKVNFEESHSRAVMYQLQELYLEGLPKLKHIWKKDPQAELSFENLQQVKVSGCRSLKDLFPASIARNLSKLVQLNVERCGKLEEIVAKEGEAKEAARFVFPKVTSITLDILPQLRTFYRGMHSSKWEVLEALRVVNCDKIELLASQLSCFQENNIEESYIDISVPPPFFLVEKDSFPILEKLILIGGGAWMMLQFSEELFCNLKFLLVYNDKSIVLFPLRILQRFRHLHELHLKSNSHEEIFSYEEDETHVGVDSKLDMVLSKLDKLTVGDCQNLIQLVPSSTCFQNLTVLKVWSCHGLKNLMTSSTAKSLVQLREMEIGSCKSMIEVVAKGGNVTEDKIIFSKLRTLKLGHLPSLSWFCSENSTFELPSLEEIIVNKCPMKYFSFGDITTPILQKVGIDLVDYTLEGGLNATIQSTHNWRVDDFWDPEMERYFRILNNAEI